MGKIYHEVIDKNWNNDVSIDANLNAVWKDIETWKDSTIDQVLNKKKELLVRMQGVQRSLQMRDNVEGLRRLKMKL